MAAVSGGANDSGAGGDAGVDGGGGKRGRRRIRNAEQQELNRLAQQRYRCVGV